MKGGIDVKLVKPTQFPYIGKGEGVEFVCKINIMGLRLTTGEGGMKLFQRAMKENVAQSTVELKSIKDLEAAEVYLKLKHFFPSMEDAENELIDGLEMDEMSAIVIVLNAKKQGWIKIGEDE